MVDQARVSTGDIVLDDALNGGLPENRAVLLTGTPGTGKSTLSMQFIQNGIAKGERCLYISTEQTKDELYASFEPFSFDLDHPNLTIRTLQAAPGKTLEDDEEQLIMQPLDDDEEMSDSWLNIPFERKRIIQYLERYAPCDRVVIDSVSGLKVLSEDSAEFRRAVLDLIQLFTSGFDATTIFTAEYTGTPHSSDGAESIEVMNTVQFNVHGVIRMWRELVAGDFHRFIDIMKMRGVDHSTRRFEIEFDETGVKIIPRRRVVASGFLEYEYMPTGIDGLDTLCGGGLLKGTGTLLEHDGQANFEVLMSHLFAKALEQGMALALVPTVEMKRRRLEKLLAGSNASVADLLDHDKLFIIDMVGAWETEHDNVFDIHREEASVRYILQMIEENTVTDGVFYILNTEAKVQGIGRDEARSFRYWLEANYIGPEDMHVDIHNPKLMGSELAEFYVDAAGQVLQTWVDESGLQYLKLKKSPIGDVGSTSLVEYLNEAPFIRIQ